MVVIANRVEIVSSAGSTVSTLIRGDPITSSRIVIRGFTKG